MEENVLDIIRENVLDNMENQSFALFYDSISSMGKERNICPYLLSCVPQSWDMSGFRGISIYENKDCFRERFNSDKKSGLFDSIELLEVDL